MPTLDDAIATLISEAHDEDVEAAKKKAKQIAGRLYSEVKAVANVLIARGGGRAAKQTTEAHQKDLDERQEEIDRLTEANEDLATQIEASKGKAPEFEKKLELQKTKYEAQIGKLKGELDQERGGRRQDKVELAIDRFRKGVERRIPDEFVADGVVSKAVKLFRPAENDQGYEVLVPGEGDEVFAPGDGEKPEDLLLETVLKTVPEHHITVGEATPGGKVGERGRMISGVKASTPEQNRTKLKRSGTY